MPALTAQNLKPSSPTWPRLLQPPKPHDTPSPRSPLLQFKGAVSFWVSWPRCRSLKSFPHLTVRKAQEGSFCSNAYIAWRLPLFEAFLEVLESRVESFESHLGGFTPSSRESDGCATAVLRLVRLKLIVCMQGSSGTVLSRVQVFIPSFR